MLILLATFQIMKALIKHSSFSFGIISLLQSTRPSVVEMQLGREGLQRVSESDVKGPAMLKCSHWFFQQEEQLEYPKQTTGLE